MERPCFIFLCLCFLASTGGYAQKFLSSGQNGTGPIHKDSSVFAGWAAGCRTSRGYLNIADTNLTCTEGGITSNRAFFGYDSLATGKPSGNMDCVSLGDGGQAILEFHRPLSDGEGPDFAVFENGFHAAGSENLYYLELAFVEVSSDGIHFVRFPSISDNQDTLQVGSFTPMDPENFHNLAGKYPRGYGTPFDLQDLRDSSGIDIHNIRQVRVIDVVGSIDSSFCSFDSRGTIINDPWPTPYWNGGFDLNAIGVIHYAQTAGTGHLYSPCRHNIREFLEISPNPVSKGDRISIRHPCLNSRKMIRGASLINLEGKTTQMTRKENIHPAALNIPGNLVPGIYILMFRQEKKIFKGKLLITE